MVKLRNLDESSIAVRGRAASWGRAWAQQASWPRGGRGAGAAARALGRATAARAPWSTRAVGPPARRPRPPGSRGAAPPPPRCDRATWPCASSRTRSTRMWAACSSPSTPFASCRCTRRTSWRSALRPAAARRGAARRPARGSRAAGAAPQRGSGAAAREGSCATRARRTRSRARARCRYHENGALGQPPHTYAIADNAYRNLMRDWRVRQPTARQDAQHAPPATASRAPRRAAPRRPLGARRGSAHYALPARPAHARR
jgi:hypothetical protein